MTSPDQIAELLARVEAATGPFRTPDGPDYTVAEADAWTLAIFGPGGGTFENYDLLTGAMKGSIQDTLALADKLLPPNTNMQLNWKIGSAFHHAMIGADETDDEWGGWNAPSLPLALLIALLKALSSPGRGGEVG